MDWPGILYDYYIHADGEISQTQPLDEVVETNEEYLANAVHVAFAGTFDEVIPTGEHWSPAVAFLPGCWSVSRT